jgi:putative transposase
MKRHHPRHIYIDDQIYFVTSHLKDKQFLLDNDLKRDKLMSKIFSFAWENSIELLAWAILNDHYHLLIKTSDGRRISNFISEIHRGFSFEMNQLERQTGRRLWSNYWDWCVRDERDYWMHFNYINNNPLKHGLVANMDALRGYRYASFWNYMRTKGIQWLLAVMDAYPVVDFTVENDE